LGNRSSGDDKKPLKNALGGTASYNTCYKTSRAQLAADGHIMKLNINLGKPYFMHSILIVQDLHNGKNVEDMNDPLKYLQNFEIYIGNNPNFALNSKCGGGPRMVLNDPTNYVTVLYPGSTGGVSMWKFGHEAWCNMEGQHMTIVADLTHMASQTSALAPDGYEMSICSLGVFGTEFVRSTAVPLTVEIVISVPLTFEVEKIAAHASLALGNTLDIMLRQKTGAAFSWVTFTQDTLVTKVNLAPDRSVPPGEYSLVLESFDLAGGVYSTLKTDTITVTVLPPPECG